MIRMSRETYDAPRGRIWHRVKTWTTVRALEAVCAVRGHQMGQHFTDLISNMTPEDGEPMWCSRCGLGSDLLIEED